MHFAVLLAVFAASRTAELLAQTDSARSPITVAATARRPTVKAGEDVKVEIDITNGSDKDIFYSPLGPVTFDVRNARGEAVPKLQTTAQGPLTGTYARMHVRPGHTLRMEFDLSEKFNLTKPGTFTVNATVRLDSTVLKSNAFGITVVPR